MNTVPLSISHAKAKSSVRAMETAAAYFAGPAALQRGQHDAHDEECDDEAPLDEPMLFPVRQHPAILRQMHEGVNASAGFLTILNMTSLADRRFLSANRRRPVPAGSDPYHL